MQLGDVATWVASVAAVVAVVIAVRTDRKSSRAANSSASDAKRAADAAEQAADAATRQTALAEAAAARYTPPWRLEWAKGDTYLLFNEGDEPVFGVEVAMSGMHVRKNFDEPTKVDPRSGITFLAAATMSTRDRNVTVTWHRHEDEASERHEWRHPLPYRP